MKALIGIGREIDEPGARVDRIVYRFVLVAVLTGAANAVLRYAPSSSASAWLEIQWYLFAAVFLFCARFALLHQTQVLANVAYGRLSRRLQTWIEILGTAFLLLPLIALIAWLSWPVVGEAYQRGTMPGDVEFMIWPARLLVPLGFGLLILRGISELIKRLLFLAGPSPDRARDTGSSESSVG